MEQLLSFNSLSYSLEIGTLTAKRAENADFFISENQRLSPSNKILCSRESFHKTCKNDNH